MKKRLEMGGRCLEYELVRKRIKNINLRIDRQGTLHVSAPYFVAQTAIDRFLLANAGRILQSQSRMKANAALVADREDSFVLYGQRMETVTIQGARSGAEVKEGRIVLTLRDVGDGAQREKALEALLRRTAEMRVRDCCRRIYPAFSRMGVAEPKEITFRAMKRSWGNCRPTEGRLCFNTALARVPERCVEYVVCHEFCHFIYADHSPRFHALMSGLMPDWKERKKTLEKFAPLM